jgi:hypothetical protein
MRLASITRWVGLVVVVQVSEVETEAAWAVINKHKMDDLPADPMESQCAKDGDNDDHHGRSHRDCIPESECLLLVGGNANARGLRGILPGLIRPPEQVNQS